MERLTASLTALHDLVASGDRPLRDHLQRLVRLAANVFPRCSGASISLLVEGRATSVAVTDQVALELDVAQYDNDEGPCLAAMGGQVVRVGFVAEDERFPHFAVGAADRRVASVLSTPISDEGHVVGTLNLYSHERDAFDARSEEDARIFAAEAATAIVTSRLFEQAHKIRRAIQREHDDSAEVAMAEGVLMAQQGCTRAQAVALLRNASDANAERLVDAARRIVAATAHGAADREPSE